MEPPVALTIAGSDPSGSSGLQADLPTFAALGVHALSVTTLLTAQNAHGISGFYPMTLEQVIAQLESLLEDFEPQATKTGLLFDHLVVEAVVERANCLGNLVVDPVLVNSAGAQIVDDAVVEAYKGLASKATVLTPNRWEAELLSGSAALPTTEAIDAAAEALRNLGAEVVVVTGGRGEGAEVVDVVVTQTSVVTMASARIGTEAIRGTGCTLSAAIAAILATGVSVEDAIAQGRGFVGQQLALNGVAIAGGRPGVPHIVAPK